MTRGRGMLAAFFAALAVAALAWTCVLAVTGGVNTTMGGVRVSSNNLWRPLAAGAVATAIWFFLLGPRGAWMSIARFARAVTAARLAWLLAATTTAVGLAGNSWTASGPDSYAYVSQAELWRTRTLDLPVPLAADAPWPNAVATFATPGYRPAPDGRAALVPVTAPGLPLLMAAAQTIGGHAAAFVITPVAGGVLVLFTFFIGQRIGAPRAGLAAAWLVATSPAVLYMLMWPMTDVPTAAITAVMTWCLLGESLSSAVVAGLTVAAGLVVRPNFSVIAGAAWLWLVADAAWLSTSTARWRRVVAFTFAAIPGEIVTVLVNLRWYDAPFASGYGAVSNLLSVDRLATNAARYTRWLAESSPVAFIGLAAIALPFSRLWPSAAARRAARLFVVTTAAAWSVYLFYAEFVDWWYLRFLLPAWPAMFIGAAIALERLAVRGPALRAAVALVVIACGVSGMLIARDRWAFTVGTSERRYATVAHLVDTFTPRDAVILTSAHGGTLRYYAKRETLRFDFLDPEWLDGAIAWLTARGRHPYILVEDWEQPYFENRFAGASALAPLAFPPVFSWHSAHTSGDVRLYDPLSRDGSTAVLESSVEDALPISATPVER